MILAIFVLALAIGSFFIDKFLPILGNIPFPTYTISNDKEPKNGEAKEIVEGLVIIRNLDKEIIRQKIEQGKEFLYRMEKEEEHGFYKKYEALNDSFENRLHTVYSASIIYTFLYIYDLEKDEEILEHLSGWGDFLLLMQNKDEEDKRYGAFHYSYYLDNKEREKKFVVGTAGLSIFTLLRLYELTRLDSEHLTGQAVDEKYLESAKLAGNWLITMQKEDGSIKPYVRYSEGKWVYGKKASLLYNGQTLSALSKLYGATGDKKYYTAAQGIAQFFAKKYEKERACPVPSEQSEDWCGGYIEGEYRKKNPISNAWVVMSSLDFYKASPVPEEQDYYKKIVFELSDIILGKQIKDTDDIFNHGRWKGAYSTSGIGWIAEVMTEVYRFCKEQDRKDCDKYKEAVVRAIRWLVQNTYSEENTLLLPNPQRALGGVFWNKDNKYVRTDSVCHALNSYVRIMPYLEDGLLLSIPKNLQGLNP